jgi:hypothetical protein
MDRLREFFQCYYGDMTWYDVLGLAVLGVVCFVLIVGH